MTFSCGGKRITEIQVSGTAGAMEDTDDMIVIKNPDDIWQAFMSKMAHRPQPLRSSPSALA
jgi:hypothetical protein